MHDDNNWSVWFLKDNKRFWYTISNNGIAIFPREIALKLVASNVNNGIPSGMHYWTECEKVKEWNTPV